MELTYEVELDYGDDGPEEGEPSPTGDDMARFVRKGMEAEGWTSVDVSAVQR